MSHSDPFLAIDRAHELAGEREEDFDAALARETAIQRSALLGAAVTGDAGTLDDLAEALAHALSKSRVMQDAIRGELSCPAPAGGRTFLKLAGECLDAMAETAALAELERGQGGGLDVAAMRAVAPAGVRVADWSAK